MPRVHPTSVVSEQCEIASDAHVGPFCVITGQVRLEAGVQLLGHVHLSGPVRIGPRTVVYPFACLGFPPQDYKFKPGDATAGVTVGAECIIREHVTVHAASKMERPTTLGDRVFMMVNSHVGHDGQVGSGVILVNNVALGGHSEVHDGAIVSGSSVIHQFTRVGRLAFLQGDTAVSMDVPPFCLAYGHNAMAGINLVGLRRAGLPREQITRIREAFRLAFRRPLTKPERTAVLEKLGADCPPVMEMARFVAEAKKIVLPPEGRTGDEEVVE